MKLARSFGTAATTNPATQLHIPEDLDSQHMQLFMNDFSLSNCVPWAHYHEQFATWIYTAYVYNWSWVSNPEAVCYERQVSSAVP